MSGGRPLAIQIAAAFRIKAEQALMIHAAIIGIGCREDAWLTPPSSPNAQ